MDGIKGWIQSKTIWIGWVFQAVGAIIAVGTTVAGFLPEMLSVQIMSYIIIAQAGVFQANRFFTKLGISFKPIVKKTT